MISDNRSLIRILGASEEVPYPLLLLADETKEAIGHYLPDASVYVWEEEDNMIAVYVLTITGAESVEIMNLAVEPSRQGEGIGLRMLEHATETARSLGFSRLDIGTSNAAWGPLYLYQKAGFEIDRLRKDFYRKRYPAPIRENRLLLNHMIVLRKTLR